MRYTEYMNDWQGRAEDLQALKRVVFGTPLSEVLIKIADVLLFRSSVETEDWKDSDLPWYAYRLQELAEEIKMEYELITKHCHPVAEEDFWMLARLVYHDRIDVVLSGISAALGDLSHIPEEQRHDPQLLEQAKRIRELNSSFFYGKSEYWRLVLCQTYHGPHSPFLFELWRFGHFFREVFFFPHYPAEMFSDVKTRTITIKRWQRRKRCRSLSHPA